MRNIFIFHGSYGNPEENWFPWLKSKLETLGHKVFVPRFPVPDTDPTPGGHKLDEWMKSFEAFRKYLDKDAFIIAHSRGCTFTYRLFETLKSPIDSTFFVGPWIVYRWYPKNKTITDSFHLAPFDWKKIKRGSKYFEIFQSTNDDTPVSEGKELAQKLGATLDVVKNAGHFNVAYDKKFKEFDFLLERIKIRLMLS